MKILLPVDGSDCAEKTCQWITGLFDKQTSEYYLIYVMPVITDFPVVESALAEATEMLRQAQANLEKQGCRVADSGYLLGFPVERICEYAETHDMDLVVIGSHGRTGLSKLLMGSVSEGVLEHCKCPVVIYKNIEARREEAVQGGHPLSHTVL